MSRAPTAAWVIKRRGSISRGQEVMVGGEFRPQTREALKEMVRTGETRLLLGTDAASEGLNLQHLGTLINLDLPWNPTRLEQHKGSAGP
jgi:superfamily II DNA/RNA helicase